MFTFSEILAPVVAHLWYGMYNVVSYNLRVRATSHRILATTPWPACSFRCLLYNPPFYIATLGMGLYYSFLLPISSALLSFPTSTNSLNTIP